MKPGCVASCEKMWEDVTLPIGVKFSKAQWFLISLSPAILEIMMSPVKNQKIIQIFLCCQSSLQMFWRCCRASNHSISVQFNCASCFGNTGKGVSNHHNPMNEQHGETERERDHTERSGSRGIRNWDFFFSVHSPPGRAALHDLMEEVYFPSLRNSSQYQLSAN